MSILALHRACMIAVFGLCAALTAIGANDADIRQKPFTVVLDAGHGGKDFGLYLKKARGCYFKAGTRKLREDGISYPHHHGRFCMEEAGLKTGVAVWQCQS